MNNYRNCKGMLILKSTRSQVGASIFHPSQSLPLGLDPVAFLGLTLTRKEDPRTMPINIKLSGFRDSFTLSTWKSDTVLCCCGFFIYTSLVPPPVCSICRKLRQFSYNQNAERDDTVACFCGSNYSRPQVASERRENHNYEPCRHRLRGLRSSSSTSTSTAAASNHYIDEWYVNIPHLGAEERDM